MVIGGVLERFPDLHLIPTEMGVRWVPPLLQAMDAGIDDSGMQASREHVSRRVKFDLKPSELWERQCFVTHSHSQRREEFEGEFYDSVPNMVLGTDTGHAEGWWPVYGFPEPAPKMGPKYDLPVIPCEEAYEALWHGLPATKMLPYLQDNFFRAYPNVDRAALDGVVDRIGPTVGELGLV
jgi:hypothetical protein